MINITIIDTLKYLIPKKLKQLEMNIDNKLKFVHFALNKY